MSLRFLNQQPPGVHVKSAPVNRTRHIRSVTSAVPLDHVAAITAMLTFREHTGHWSDNGAGSSPTPSISLIQLS